MAAAAGFFISSDVSFPFFFGLLCFCFFFGRGLCVRKRQGNCLFMSDYRGFFFFFSFSFLRTNKTYMKKSSHLFLASFYAYSVLAS